MFERVKTKWYQVCFAYITKYERIECVYCFISNKKMSAICYCSITVLSDGGVSMWIEVEMV